LTFFGCGGGGGGGGGGGALPTPVATIGPPLEQVVIPAGGDINDAIATHSGGATIIVSGGVYEPIVINPGTVFGTIFIQAGDEVMGKATILGDGEDAAITIIGQTNIVIDGLQIIGGDTAGIYVANSTAIEVRNCIVRGANDGVVFDQVANGLLFDTLIYENRRNGVMGLGTDGFRIVNNTIFGQPGDAIFIGASPGDAVSILAGNTLVQNNSIDGNIGVGIKMESGNDEGYFGAYNINRDGYQGVGFPPPPGGSCRFAECNFRVQVASGTGSSPAIDRGDPDTDPVLLSALRDRTIRSDNFSDGEVADIGYHYPFGMVTPTPFPTTPTPGAAGPTRTPTATPTQ
jgi:hypothetical protein